MYIRVVPAFMFMNCIHAEHPQRSEEVLRLPWTALKDSLGVTAGNSTQVLCNREQYVILTTVQSISQVPPQHLKRLSPTENSMLQRARPCGTFLIQIIIFTKALFLWRRPVLWWRKLTSLVFYFLVSVTHFWQQNKEYFCFPSESSLKF